MKEKYLTVKEVAEQLGISVQAVYKRMDKDFKPFIVEVENKKLLKYGVLKQFSLNKNSTKVEISTEVESLKKYIDHLEKEVEQLRAENEALRSENSKLVTELMSLSSRVGASLEQLTSTNLANALLEAHQLQEKNEIEVVEQKKPRGFFGLFHKK